MLQNALPPASSPSARLGAIPDRKTRRRRIRIALVLVDMAMLLFASFGATLIRFRSFTAPVALQDPSITLEYQELALLVAFFWLPFLHIERLYDLDRLFWGAGELSRVVKAISLGVVGFILLTYALKLPGFARGWTLLTWTLAVGFVSFGRLMMRFALRRLRAAGRLLRPTLVVGSNSEAERLVRILRADPGQGMVPVGYLASTKTDAVNGEPIDGVPLLGSSRDLYAVVRAHRIDTVIVASSAFSHDVISRIIAELGGLSVDIHVSLGLFEILTSRVLVREVGGVPLVTIKRVSLSRSKLVMKRALDLAVAITVMGAGLPLWLLLVLLIKLNSSGPVFYKQARVGRGGELFGMYKFRSMCDDADARLAQLLEDNEADGPLFKMKDDPRITPVGRWMRRFSIDEFPQVINVLKGEMSVVGPRPPLIQEAEAYTVQHSRRLEVLPGMTGLWQVSGRSDLSFDEMVRLDLFYIENWSLRLDLGLILRTIPAVLFARGAY